MSKNRFSDTFRAAFYRKTQELPAPPVNPCKEIQFPGTPRNPYLIDHLVSIEVDKLFDMNTLVPQKTAADVLAEQKQMEAFRANLQKQEAERAMASRFRASKDPMLKHLKALLEELAPTQLLLQSPHYTALAQLIEQIEKAPTGTPEFNSYGNAVRQEFKENFTG